MPWLRPSGFSNVTSVGKVPIITHGAWGLHLDEVSRAGGFGGKSVTVMNKEKIDLVGNYAWKILTAQQPKVAKLALRMPFLVQSPRFATNYNFLAMNSQA
jgi:hypothetical protein